MSHFRYRAITPAGDFVDGEVEAPSREEVIRRIEYLGHVTIEVEAATTSMLARSSVFRNRTPRPRDMTIFLRQLAVLVGANLVATAVRFVLLRNWVFNPRRRGQGRSRPAETISSHG